jgi:hypothetical protein
MTAIFPSHGMDCRVVSGSGVVTGGKSVKPSRAVMPFDDALLARWRRNGAEMVQKQCARGGGEIWRENVPNPEMSQVG